jgi:hypothetical protein
MPASKLKPSFSGDVGVLVSWEEVRHMVGDVNVVGAEGVEGRRPAGVLTRGWENGDGAAEEGAGLGLNADSAFGAADRAEVVEVGSGEDGGG